MRLPAWCVAAALGLSSGAVAGIAASERRWDDARRVKALEEGADPRRRLVFYKKWTLRDGGNYFLCGSDRSGLLVLDATAAVETSVWRLLPAETDR